LTSPPPEGIIGPVNRKSKVLSWTGEGMRIGRVMMLIGAMAVCGAVRAAGGRWEDRFTGDQVHLDRIGPDR
jgi:hypothetical protein